MQVGWDTHTHLLPAGLTDLAKAGKYGMTLGDGFIGIDHFKLMLAKMNNPDALVEHINKEHLQGAVAAVPPPLFRADLLTSDRREYVQFINDGLLEKVANYPQILPMAYLPSDDPALALEIAQNLGDEWVGVIMGTALKNHSYADQTYHPLWALLVERNLMVHIHPSESSDPRLKPFYLSNLLGNPMETTLAAAQLIFGDIPGLFPDLRVMLSHAGGAMPALIGRWQRGYETDRPGISKLQLSPCEAAKWFYVDTITHADPMLKAVLKTLSAERVVLGSDWPFPMGSLSPSNDLIDLSADQISAIRQTNAVNLFAIEAKTT